jgi:hypothetical protein
MQDLPPVNTRLFKLGFLSRLNVTAEHWHPNEPLVQIWSGRRHYLASAIYVFVDGRQVLRNLFCAPGSETPNAVLLRTCEEVRKLAPLKIDDCKDAQGEWPPLHGYTLGPYV